MATLEKLKLDIMVMKVGMGGWLNATNAIPNGAVVVSALASVDLGRSSETRRQESQEKRWGLRGEISHLCRGGRDSPGLGKSSGTLYRGTISEVISSELSSQLNSLKVLALLRPLQYPPLLS